MTDVKSGDAKAAILGRVRRALDDAPRLSAAEIAAEAARLLPERSSIQPQFAAQSSRARFIEKATSERLTATVDEVDAMPSVVDAVRRYVARSNLPQTLAVPPLAALQDLHWGDLKVGDTISSDEPVAIGMADYAIAETGSLVFTSRPETPTLFNYLPLHHVVVVEAGTILRYMEDYWDIVRARGNTHPRNTNFITGTSGTADIEAKNVRGAHGPRFLHIIIVGAEAGAA